MSRKTGGYHSRFMAGTALTLVLIASSSAFAQEQAAKPDETEVNLKTIVVRKAEPNAPSSTTDQVSRVSRTTMDRFGGKKIDDTLRNVPGVFTRINGSQPGVAVNIRGFEGSGRVNMMVDGVRQNFRFTGHEAQGFTYVDPNLLANIDVTRGATTGTGGSGLAGSVNFRTLGVSDIVEEGKQWGVLGRASWGSNGVGFSEMLAGGARIDAMGIAAAISRRDSRSYKNGDNTRQPNTGQEMTSGLFKTEFGFGEDQHLTLGGVFYKNDFAANSYDQTLKNNTLTANYSYNPGDNDLIDLRVNAHYNETSMRYNKGLNSYATSVGREITDKGFGFDVSNTSNFAINDVNISWQNGVEYFSDKISGFKAGTNPTNGRSSSGALFSEAKFSYGLADLTTGLRYNFFKLDGDANDGSQLVDRSINALAPKVTLAINVTDWLQPYVTYSHSMRAPTLQETMLGGTAHGGGMLPNPYLEPEKQRGWEVGFNLAQNDIFLTSDRLSMKANYYDMTVENYIVSQCTANFRACQFANIAGNTSVRGFELEANYDAGFTFAGIGYSHTKTDMPRQMPGFGASQYLPDDIFTLTAGARFLEDKLTAGARYNYVSRGKNATYTGTDRSDSYALVDVFANYKFTENVDLTLKVNNVFNKTYKPALSTSGDGQGRSFMVATQFKF
ncbi:hemoglobin/transferrin/lactoferrin receptor protein [Paenochrobactrum gallinarii]|uniref:Heme transporter BhuA n=1 Tax=Paenochrobactrum gallinarii TaxID=643673 RepID=A0A841M8N2_9HYPH|nr:TonB-dependent receptor [Paenochrobactrum gallinarii]MBB6262498.1 hemoglobin/transferrin/lactoferrin receptor protein [Paenochrobactrum gallinarii]